MLPHVVWLDDPTTLTKPGQANSKLGVDRVTPGTSSRAGQDRPSGGRPPGRPLWGGDPMADTPAHLPAREPDDDLDLRSVVRANHPAINDAFQAATAVEPRQNEPRRQLIAADGFLAVLSRHVTAVEDTLYPAVRQLPDGRETAQFCLHCTHSARPQPRGLE